MEILFRGQVLTIIKGSRYLGGYIGDNVTQARWLGEKVEDWEGGIWMMVRFACKRLQSGYEGLQNSFQQEWVFVNRIWKLQSLEL